MSELIDNRAHRVRMLKEIIRHLHSGEAPEEVRDQLKQIVRECDTTEIAQMEQELIAEGLPVEEIMSMCDLHSQVVQEILVDRPIPLITPGHPVQTIRKENLAIEEKVAELRSALEGVVTSSDNEEIKSAVRFCQSLLNELMDVDKHYQRKENLLFPLLERHGITGPSKVMWGKDDEIRELLDALREALQVEDVSPDEWKLVIETVAEPAFSAIKEMIYKEEKILLPMAMQTLTDMEWGEIWEQSPEFGWCLVEPEVGYKPPVDSLPEPPEEIVNQAERSGIALNIMPAAEKGDSPVSGSLIFPTGSLTLEQLKAIFQVLPVDVTFVDAEDRVRFFNEGADRVFARPRAVIGRKVQHCHPPGSVHIVEKIVADFRANKQDVAEFWIELGERFVHIRYFAVRDEKGEYMGTLEVTQDVTRPRSLTGERRLLQYEE